MPERQTPLVSGRQADILGTPDDPELACHAGSLIEGVCQRRMLVD